MKVSKKIINLETESAFAVLAKANKLISEGKDVINLGIGQPDFPTPLNIQEAAIKAIKDLKVNYLTIHISSGLQALKAAKKVSGKIKLVGVSILTSLDDKSVKQIGFSKKVKDLVKYQARLASKAKLDAMVCSPLEVKLVKKTFNEIPSFYFNIRLFSVKQWIRPRRY